MIAGEDIRAEGAIRAGEASRRKAPSRPAPATASMPA